MDMATCPVSQCPSTMAGQPLLSRPGQIGTNSRGAIAEPANQEALCCLQKLVAELPVDIHNAIPRQSRFMLLMFAHVTHTAFIMLHRIAPSFFVRTWE